MILGLIFIEKVMFFTVENALPYQCVGKGKVLTVKIIDFLTRIDPKIIWKIRRKKFNFYFHVGNVFFDAGEHGERMGTFLRCYRLEKSPNFALYFSHSITIGISIQMIICCICFISVHFDPPGELARRESSRQGKLKLSETVQTPCGHKYPPKHSRSWASGSQNKVP